MPSLVARARGERGALPTPESVVLSSSWGSMGSDSARVSNTYVSYATYGLSANAPVYACAQARLQLLSQAEFKWQDLRTKRLFGTEALAPLESPWPSGTTADLVSRMEQAVTLSGNAFVRRTPDGTLVLLRADWVDILSAVRVEPDGREHVEVLGYMYSEGGYGVGVPQFFDAAEVAHWSPYPDPLNPWKGMSWLTPVLREINADVAMTQHRQTFFDQAGTPNLILKYAQKLQPETLESIRQRWRSRFGGPARAGSTVVLDEGGDLTVVGSTFESMRFNEVQSAGEARIAAASGVPAIVAGLQAGLDAATYSNYAMAMKAFGNGTAAYLWRSMCSALGKLVDAPPGARLWWDTTNIPALREDERDRAANMQTLAAAASTLLTAGYTSDSILAALTAGDLTLLEHTGLVSVQLHEAKPSAPQLTGGSQ